MLTFKDYISETKQPNTLPMLLDDIDHWIKRLSGVAEWLGGDPQAVIKSIASTNSWWAVRDVEATMTFLQQLKDANRLPSSKI